ncbi:MAG: hypothetical protein IJD07_00555 [Clostridia bacterium]|nr:hypothetical protein [Clostridia bacterium]
MDDIEFLKFIHEQAEMGVVTLSKMNEMNLDEQVRLTLESQILDYKNVMCQAKRKLNALGEQPKALNPLATKGAEAMISMKTVTDKSNTHIAAMVLKGSTNGIVETTQKINQADDVSDDAKNLGYKLLLSEERNIEQMRRYL